MHNSNKHPNIRLLSLGEGVEKGIAAKHAEKLVLRNKQGRVLAIDLMKHNYQAPHNMSVLQGNALAFLGTGAKEPFTFQRAR